MVFKDIIIVKYGIEPSFRPYRNWVAMAYQLSRTPDEIWARCLKSAYKQLCEDGKISYIKAIEETMTPYTEGKFLIFPLVLMTETQGFESVAKECVHIANKKYHQHLRNINF